jgi:hypothetical protein
MRIELPEGDVDEIDVKILDLVEKGAVRPYEIYMKMRRKPEDDTVARRVSSLLARGYLRREEGGELRIEEKARDLLRRFRRTWFPEIKLEPSKTSSESFSVDSLNPEAGKVEGMVVSSPGSLRLLSGSAQYRGSSFKPYFSSITGDRVLAG